MKKIRHLLLSRSFILAVILLITLTIVAGYLFPQKMTSSSLEIKQWKEEHPLLSPIYESSGLDHVYTSPWFSMLLTVLALSLTLSTVDQVKSAFRRTFGNIPFTSSKTVVTVLNTGEIEHRMKALGYIKTCGDDKTCRFIRHPWGNWGNALLHAGIVSVIFSALIITITEYRGLLHLVEGELYIPGEPWVVEEAGMLASRFILPVSVRLEKIKTEFWETDDVKNISTILSITDADGHSETHTLGINKTIDRFGLRIYQGRRFGDAFFIEITDRQGRLFREILQIEKPRRRDRPSYGNFFIDGIPFMLKVKYYADARQRTIQSYDPLLVMRLVSSRQSIENISKSGERRLKMRIKKEENIAGEVSLRLNESKPFGPYTARLVGVRGWCGIIFVRSFGASGIFTGFFIIITGVSLAYLFPPREALLRRDNGTTLLYWRAAKFEPIYEGEFNKIKKSIMGDYSS
jgi:hypothetical protein